MLKNVVVSFESVARTHPIAYPGSITPKFIEIWSYGTRIRNLKVSNDVATGKQTLQFLIRVPKLQISMNFGVIEPG
jgi:hypothetical protein